MERKRNILSDRETTRQRDGENESRTEREREKDYWR